MGLKYATYLNIQYTFAWLAGSVEGRHIVTLYHLILFIHVLLGVVWVGGIIHSEVQIIGAERSRDPG